jgi:hypothetical protein
MKHKLMQAMKVRDDAQPLSGTIQLDNAYWGEERRGGKARPGRAGQSPFVAAVATNAQGHPIEMRFTRIKSFRIQAITQWPHKHMDAACVVVSDGLNCFPGVKRPVVRMRSSSRAAAHPVSIWKLSPGSAP